MDSLFNILGRKDFDEPAEVQAIKKYVSDTFKAKVTVMVREKDIIIIAPNAPLANSIKLNSSELKRRCQIEKRLTFRIG